jgi:hypothetical protein
VGPLAGDVPSDDEVIAAANAFADAYGLVIERVYSVPFATSPVDIVRGMSMPDVEEVRREALDSLDPVLELRPEGFHEIATRINDALQFVDEGSPRSGGFWEGHATAGRRLGSWHGDGAEAFQVQFERMGKFAAEQAEAMTRLGGYMLTAYKVAGLARRDTVALFHGGAAACQALAARNEADQTRVDIALSAGVVQSTLTALASSSALAGSLGVGVIAVGVAATVVTVDVAAASPADVVDRVRQERTGLVDRMNGELAQLQVPAQQDFTDYGRPDTALLRDPLPPSTDVDSPNFRYGDFSSPARTDPDFARAVEDPPPPPTDQPGVSRIRSALG